MEFFGERFPSFLASLYLTRLGGNRPRAHPQKQHIFILFFPAIPFEYIRPTKREVLAAAEHVAMKDAPILAAARKARVDLLVTLDKKHLLGKPELTEISRVAIVTPEGAVEYLQKTN